MAGGDEMSERVRSVATTMRIEGASVIDLGTAGALEEPNKRLQSTVKSSTDNG